MNNYYKKNNNLEKALYHYPLYTEHDQKYNAKVLAQKVKENEELQKKVRFMKLPYKM